MARLLRRRPRRILVDVDTQYDLIYNSDLNVSAFLCNVRRLMAWARVRRIPVVSTALVRRRSETGVELPNSNTNCVEGTPGQKKISYTMLPRHISFGPENCHDLPLHVLMQYQQAIFEKRTEDPFTQPRADRLLSEVRCDEFIIFGTGLENALKATALGLLHRKKNVSVIVDSVLAKPGRVSILAMRQIEAKGATLIHTSTLTGHSRLIGSNPHLSISQSTSHS